MNANSIKRNSRVLAATAAGSMCFFTCLFLEQALICPSLNYTFPFVGYGGTFQQNFTGVEHVPWYPLMFGIGVWMTILLALMHRKTYHMSTAQSICFTVTIIFSAYGGAKILYLLENPESWEFALTSFGGVSLYGAIFLVPVFLLPCAWISRRKWSRLTDYAAPIALNLLAVMRIGCFMKGCCGSPIHWFGNNPVILPVQLIESTLNLIFLGVILRMEEKRRYEGIRYPIFMGIYGCYRFVLEILRDTPKDFLGMSNGQILSLLGILVAMMVIYTGKERKKDTIRFFRKSKV